MNKLLFILNKVLKNNIFTSVPLLIFFVNSL